MKLNGRWLIIYTIALIILIQGAYGVQITASGGGNGKIGSVEMNFDTLKTTAVSAQMKIDGATVTPYAAIAGPIPKFEQTHSVKDATGKSASVYVKVLNAPSGLTYTSKVLPKEGTLTTTQTQVSAEQWLTVPKASSIKCTATASYGTTRSSSVGLEEAKNALVAGDYVTLSGYYGKAVTTGTSVLASQTATSGAANSIKIYGTAKDSSGTSRIDTSLTGISGGKAILQGLSETASTGTTVTNQVSQKEHLHGTFTSTASYTPTVGTALYKTRTSDYGTEYDISIKAAKGSLPTGILGYYVKPGMKIQGAVNAAQSKDTINVVAGTYKENVKIDKSLTINGAGRYSTIVDGNKLGSVFTIGSVNPNIDVILSGLGITGGYYMIGGGIYNTGRSTIINSLIFANRANDGGGIYNSGPSAKLTVSSSKISGNTANLNGGGILNSGPTAKLTVTSSTISGNSATDHGGGIYNAAGAATITGSSISGNSANLNGGGIYNAAGVATITGSTISGNSANYGGGILNSGPTGKLTVTSSTISGNSANRDGGGINNQAGIAKITGSIISGNSAGQYGFGGGIFLNLGTTTIIDSTISGNSANNDGGGVCNFEGTATIIGSTISGNSANYGGGILNSGATGKLTVSSSTISENSASGYGGGICNLGTFILKTDSHIVLNLADSDNNEDGKGGGIYKSSGNLIFQDKYGNVITDPNVINSMVFSNYLKSIGGTLSNIAP